MTTGRINQVGILVKVLTCPTSLLVVSGCRRFTIHCRCLVMMILTRPVRQPVSKKRRPALDTARRPDDVQCQSVIDSQQFFLTTSV